MRTSQTNPSSERISSFKSGINIQNCRRIREEEISSIRKGKREMMRSHSRNIIPNLELENISFDFSPFLQEEKTMDFERLEEMLRKLRIVLSYDKDELVGEIYRSGILHYFLKYLTADYSTEIQYEMAWIITNITSSHLFDNILLNYVKPLAYLFIRSPDMKTRIQSLWAITNIFGSTDIIQELTDTTFFECFILLACSIRDEEYLKVISWSIFAILRNDSTSSLIPLFIPVFRKILSENNNEEIIINVCWALYNITSTREDYYQELASHNIISVLMEKLYSEKGTVVYSAIRVLANFSMGDIEYTDEMIRHNFLIRVRELLILDSGYDIHKECCWALSNIAAGSAEHTQLILSHGILGIISKLFDNTYSRVQCEIVYIIWNILVRENPSHAEEIINCKLIYPLIIFAERKNINLVKVSLDAFMHLFSTSLPQKTLENLSDDLEVAAFQDVLENLCMSDVPDIAFTSSKILEKWDI